MVRVIVDVMPKPEILDPQGQAIAQALPTLGFAAVTSVRQGKRFEIEVADDEDPLGVGRRPPAALLANPVIEDFAVYIESSVSG
jgi:phosphoribosylformylglycinamidine synthase subunit PurS